MSIQGQLNNQAMDLIPLVQNAISSADDFDANQMLHSALRGMMDSDKPIDDMSSDEINEFQEGLIGYFKHMNWMQ